MEEINILGVIDNLKSIMGVTSDRQVALKLDVKPPTFRNSKERGLIPYKEIILYAKREKLDLNEIFFNNLEEKPKIGNSTKDINITIKNNTNNGNISSIKLLENDTNTISLPLSNFSQNDTIRAWINDKKIYIIDIFDKKIIDKNYYLIRSNKNIFAMNISIDLNGDYLLKDDEDNTTKVTPDNFKDFEIIGKINFRLKRETFI
ncbi:helix-turn-helix domain containing protein [Aliarcobacter butzleri]|uniref:Bacteriophage CI repressor N-terminal domain-containing protein n=2 Tax=Aliarcobacter butzleri TaxID=28197 RepID=A0AAW7Q1H7_9BACT|nr:MULTISPECIES: helix-turn-helix domain-containing protein [Arcobacteraceae]KLD99297.1 hypothetical protein AA20_07210 [Aliarcobacter butzleri L348]MCG3655441.1 helix-turn-helix domain containing protein [Aliarcobacter butzleri]MCG3684342.1 helix-turn-helix domain containing protein [Aliarcobacter butzleri]MCG3686478.1 helix-turn-helix domain containing protein [Aliarcobacter butzleri]MCG3688474.1 helix-turn-helix domain containing protein [Aliarcobacter butzleri]